MCGRKSSFETFLCQEKSASCSRKLQQQMDNPVDPTSRELPPLAPEVLQQKAREMQPGHEVTLYWRKRAKTGRARPYTKQVYTVEAAVRAPAREGAEDEDNYAWLVPVDRPKVAEPFPELGEDGCDFREYSCVEISGGPPESDDETPPAPSRRARPSQERPRNDGSTEGNPESSNGDRSCELDPLRVVERAVAEDPAQWPRFLCGADPAANAVHYTLLLGYYRKEFGRDRPDHSSVGRGPDSKQETEHCLSTIFEQTHALMLQPAMAMNPRWIDSLLRNISLLDIKRDETNGMGKPMLDSLRRKYVLEKGRPDWQTKARAEAAAEVKLSQVHYDPATTTQAARKEDRGGRGDGRGRGGGGRKERLQDQERKTKAERRKERAFESLKGKRLEELTGGGA